MNAEDQNISCTFYRLGPSSIFWFYPIDQNPIKKKTPNPVTEDYKGFSVAIEHINPLGPDWFLKKENELVQKILLEDIIYLAEIYGMNGACSQAAALRENSDNSIFIYELSGMGGGHECMVDFEQMMCGKDYISMIRCWPQTTRRRTISIVVPLKSIIVSMVLPIM